MLSPPQPLSHQPFQINVAKRSPVLLKTLVIYVCFSIYMKPVLVYQPVPRSLQVRLSAQGPTALTVFSPLSSVSPVHVPNHSHIRRRITYAVECVSLNEIKLLISQLRSSTDMVIVVFTLSVIFTGNRKSISQYLCYEGPEIFVFYLTIKRKSGLTWQYSQGFMTNGLSWKN
jgi:hypothetical protein